MHCSARVRAIVNVVDEPLPGGSGDESVVAFRFFANEVPSAAAALGRACFS